MPATPSRIGFILEPFRKANVEDPAVKTLYGALARSTNPSEPVETFFDSVTDAGTMAQERLDLLGSHRRRFMVRMTDAGDVLDLPLAGKVPVVTLVDDEKGVDRNTIACRLTFDLARQSAAMTLWG